MNPTQLDPQIVNLAKAIRQTESGGNFKAQGKSGEFGAYQFTQPTWNVQAPKYGITTPLTQATPEQQNEVAYKQLADWKSQNPNWNIGNFASAWNAGVGESNAYLGTFSNGKSSIGTNSFGIKYSVPDYAKSVATAYQTIKSGGNVGVDPNNPSSVASLDTQSASIGGFLNNAVDSTGKLISGIGSAIIHPIKTVENLASIVGGAGEKLLGINNQDTQNFDNVVHYFAGRYGGSSLPEIVQNIGHTLYTDPAGAALDLSTLLDGVGGAVGAVGKIGDVAKATELAKATDFISTANGILKSSDPAAIEALRTNGTLTKIADAVKTVSNYTNPINPLISGAKGLANLGARGVGESLGLSTGGGFGALKGAYEAGKIGGDAQTAFRAGISGGESGGDALVQSVQDAYRSIKNEQQSAYQSQLETIKNNAHTLTTQTIAPILSKFDELLKKFDVIKTPEGTLDFSNSRLASEPSSMTDIQQISKEISKYQDGVKQINPANIDHLKQFITDRYTGGSRGSAFTTPLADTVRTVLKNNVNGYEKLTADYAQTANELKDLKALSLGGKAGKETILKKITSTMRGNNEHRLKLFQYLENKTGKNLISQASGVALHSAIPLGLVKYTESLAVLLGPHTMASLLPLIATSPRIVGEFVNVLGKGNAKLEAIGNAFIKYKGIPALKVGTVANQSSQK